MAFALDSLDYVEAAGPVHLLQSDRNPVWGSAGRLLLFLMVGPGFVTVEDPSDHLVPCLAADHALDHVVVVVVLLGQCSLETWLHPWIQPSDVAWVSSMGTKGMGYLARSLEEKQGTMLHDRDRAVSALHVPVTANWKDDPVATLLDA